MTITEIRSMTSRQMAEYFSTVKRDELIIIIKNEKLSGYSKFNKKQLISVVLDLVEGIETDLTKQLKIGIKERKSVSEEVKMYRDMIKNKTARFDTPNKPTYYNYFVGDITKEGNFKEQRKKYLKMIKYFHPDMKTGDESKFKDIQESWEDAEKELKEFECFDEEEFLKGAW